MYVCMCVEMPMGSGVPTGPRGGTHRDRGSNVPTPRYHRYRVTHAGSYLHTWCALCSQLYSRQLRVTGFLMLEEKSPIHNLVKSHSIVMNFSEAEDILQSRGDLNLEAHLIVSSVAAEDLIHWSA